MSASAFKKLQSSMHVSCGPPLASIVELCFVKEGEGEYRGCSSS